jgi:hypothetical protein
MIAVQEWVYHAYLLARGVTTLRQPQAGLHAYKLLTILQRSRHDDTYTHTRVLANLAIHPSDISDLSM